MVKNTGEASGAGPIRPLNLPTPVAVEEDEGHRPAAVTLRGRRLVVASIEDTWEIADEWWRPKPLHRAYYAAIMEDGTKVTVFRDLVAGGWYQQRGLSPQRPQRPQRGD